jgi:hypothetical protein
VLALVFAALTLAAPAPAPHPHARFVGAVEQAKAHLLVCGELYAAGQASEAALHASHPVQEIGGRIYGPVKRVDAALGERVQAALKRARRDVDAKVPRAELQRTLDATLAMLDEATARVVPAALAGTVVFKVAVLREMLVGLEKEYDEAYKQGKITQLVEYHDAYAFFARAQALYRDLVPALRQTSTSSAAAADERMALLGRAFPGLTPPTPPISVAALREHLAVLSRALDAVPATS